MKTRIAALYDIHGNLPALEAVLAEIEQAGVDRIVVGGDVVPGPMPRECINLLFDAEVPVHFIHGNGEREVLAQIAGTENPRLPEVAREAIRWTARELGPEHIQRLQAWPPTFSLEIDDLGSVLFCHATPENDTDIFTRLTPAQRLTAIFEDVAEAVVVCGHTHMQFDMVVNDTRVVNAGSVGMPFGEPGADWLLLSDDVELRHTPYDLHAAAQRIRAAPYPQADYFAQQHVLTPPTAAQMLELFARSEPGTREPNQ